MNGYLPSAAKEAADNAAVYNLQTCLVCAPCECFVAMVWPPPFSACMAVTGVVAMTHSILASHVMNALQVPGPGQSGSSVGIAARQSAEQAQAQEDNGRRGGGWGLPCPRQLHPRASGLGDGEWAISKVRVQGYTPCQNAHANNVELLEHVRGCVNKWQIHREPACPPRLVHCARNSVYARARAVHILTHTRAHTPEDQRPLGPRPWSFEPDSRNAWINGTSLKK